MCGLVVMEGSCVDDGGRMVAAAWVQIRKVAGESLVERRDAAVSSTDGWDCVGLKEQLCVCAGMCEEDKEWAVMWVSSEQRKR